MKNLFALQWRHGVAHGQCASALLFVTALLTSSAIFNSAEAGAVLPTAGFMAGGTVSAQGISSGAVVNQGNIKSANGNVAIIGQSVINSGSISAPNGKATLAAADSVALQVAIGASGGVQVQIQTARAASPTAAPLRLRKPSSMRWAGMSTPWSPTMAASCAPVLTI